MFKEHHPLRDFVKGKEGLFCVVLDDKNGCVSKGWTHNGSPADYIALALGLVFDNSYDAEQKIKELVEKGKLIEKQIIKNTIPVEVV